jgi:hypothetical protein
MSKSKLNNKWLVDHLTALAMESGASTKGIYFGKVSTIVTVTPDGIVTEEPYIKPTDDVTVWVDAALVDELEK